LKIGSTEYYAETTNTTVGSLDPSIVSAQIWKSINADLSVSIKPTVSSSEFVTLELDVQQADFDPNSIPGQPRGTTSRSFQSTIRVKNGDMILLGGLEGKSSGKAGSGIPLLSRIPVLKWFFGKRSMSKSKTQLKIFVKPTIIY
jgi:type IV pilus assembly protein PilQ